MIYHLPLPPSANHYRKYRTVGRFVQSYPSAEYKAFVGQVKAIVGKVEPLAGRLDVSITLHFKDKRRTDIDNRVKPLLDALAQAGVYQDDKQIDKLTVVRGDVVKGGWCRVEIVEI